MTIVLYGLVTFAVLFGGALLGLFLGGNLPEKYHSDSTQKIVQTATGMVSLLAALVLGLLVATAKNKFDTTNQQTEKRATRKLCCAKSIVARIEANWPGESGFKPGPDDPPPWKLLESLQQSLTGWTPKTEAQRSEATRASQIAADLAKTTWLQAAQESDHVQHPFVVIMVLWVFVLFVSFGLFAPRNALVVLSLAIGGRRDRRSRPRHCRQGFAVRGTHRRFARPDEGRAGRNRGLLTGARCAARPRASPTYQRKGKTYRRDFKLRRHVIASTAPAASGAVR